MKLMKMGWVSYIPLEDRDSRVDKLKSQIFILSCTQRRAALKHLKIDRVKKYEYCLPCELFRTSFASRVCIPIDTCLNLLEGKSSCIYFCEEEPFKEDELEQSTEVQIIFPAEPKPIFCEFDWELDELQEFTDKLIEEEELSEDQKDAFKEFVKEKAREARKKVLQEMSEETKATFEKMRFYKFYPIQKQDSPDISNVKCLQAQFINRYYGKAHEVL
ncbi:unnamed protein product [Citrullus colocynthis]|uniref:Uncharacterized protein n=1 Tax=Citrullus colocynthis TaxID=252529 RepID=A0ABP0YNC5_9ROSI